MPEGLTESLSFGAPEYAALIVLFTGGILIIQYSFLRKLFKSNRFYDMYDDITSVMMVFDKMELSSQLPLRGEIMLLEVFRHKLIELKIPCPEVTAYNLWPPYIVKLAALAKTKQYKKAKALWKRSDDD